MKNFLLPAARTQFAWRNMTYGGPEGQLPRGFERQRGGNEQQTAAMSGGHGER